MNFKIGDVVVLKSGGPLMTIHGIGEYISVTGSKGLLCRWFDNNKVIEEVFHPDAVEPDRD